MKVPERERDGMGPGDANLGMSRPLLNLVG